MAYENINLRKPNMTMADGYFYMFDEEWDTLVEKIDDGSISFTYPLDVDLSRSYIEDDFTGSNGDPPNSDLWISSDPGVTIQDNKLELHVDSGDVSEYVYLVQHAYGNFDVQVDYELITYPSTDNWQCTLTVEQTYPGWRYRMIRGYSSAWGNYYAAQEFNGTSYVTRATVSTTDTSGKLRIYRNGTSIRVYYWSGTSWTQLYNWSSGLTDWLMVRMYMWSGNTQPAATGRLDNFSFHHKLGYVRDTQYDGRNFWTYQRIDNVKGNVIRRWDIENHVCRLRDEFLYGDTSSVIYRGNTFGVEHYITEFDCTVSGGNNVLCLDEYYDSTVASGVTLFLGPNELGEQEEVTVSTVSGSDVIVISGTQYTYESGDNVNFYKSLFVFNDYDGVSSAKGTLYRFDAYTGDYMSSQIDADYKDVTASTFVRIKNALQAYPDMHTLLYIKGTNAKLRNMSDLLSIKYASSVNDDFTGSDYDLPNTTRWSVAQGNPRILNNKLFMSSLTYANESIVSNYEIIGDFDVQVSGALNGFTTASGYSSFEHYMKINFPHDSNNNCEIGVGYCGVPRSELVAEYMMDSISGTVLYDTSGNNRDGTITGSPTIVSGITGNALKFRGTSYQDGVTLLSDADAGNVEDLFSISVWFKSETTTGNDFARVLSRDCSDYWCISVNQATAFSQDIKFYYSDTQNTIITNVIQNKWHHIVAYWDVANTTCKLYLDTDEIFSTTSLAAFNVASRPIVMGCNTEAAIMPTNNQFEGPIDDVRFYNRVLTSDERGCLYNHSPDDKIFLYTALNNVVTNTETLTSGTSAEYLFRLARNNATMNFYYKTVSSGVPVPSWTSFGSQVMYDRNCTISLGLESVLTSVSGTYFDDLMFDSGKVFYPSAIVPYYGVMLIDNLKANQVTEIDVYNVAVAGNSLYRLQIEATYYGTDYSWSPLYNYVLSTTRQFLDTVSISAYPVILPANSVNVTEVTMLVDNQYGEGILNKPVFFVDDDDVGFMTISPAYTDYFFGTGEAISYYKSGITPRTVNIEGTATQFD